MMDNLDENVSIPLSKAACLVIFELLTASYEQWQKSNPTDQSAAPMLVNASEHPQRVALWRLEGAIERTLPELFAKNYGELVAEAKRLLAQSD